MNKARKKDGVAKKVRAHVEAADQGCDEGGSQAGAGAQEDTVLDSRDIRQGVNDMALPFRPAALH